MVKGKIGRNHTLNYITLITMLQDSLESRCTVVDKQRGIKDQDRATIILRMKYDPKRLKFIVIITIKGVYNM